MIERIQDRIKRIKTEQFNKQNSQSITGSFTDANIESKRLIKRKRKPTNSYVRLQAFLDNNDLKKYQDG